jgi:hypothetical protein
VKFPPKRNDIPILPNGRWRRYFRFRCLPCQVPARRIDLATSLIGSIPKCNGILRELETLLKDLERIRDEYGKTVSLLKPRGSSGLQLVDSLLARCMADCKSTCKKYDAILTAVLKSNIRPLKWRSSQEDLKHVAIRLEAKKKAL